MTTTTTKPKSTQNSQTRSNPPSDRVLNGNRENGFSGGREGGGGGGSNKGSTATPAAITQSNGTTRVDDENQVSSSNAKSHVRSSRKLLNSNNHVNNHHAHHFNHSQHHQQSSKKRDKRRQWHWTLAAIAVVALATRLYKVHEPDHVCWDETHFGKMGSWYINRTFFFDVHPPLGKMLIGAAGHLTGYDGRFEFSKPGDKYNTTSQYLGMRIFCASLGAAVVPFAAVTVHEWTNSLRAALLTALFVTFDNGMITLSQYILLDPILLFFIFGATMASAVFGNLNRRAPFSASWWFWLTATGVFLTGAVSVKFVGLFVVALVGLRTAADLWDLLGDLSLSMRTIAGHLLARVLCLILLPVALYVAIFALHLQVLSHSGTGDGFFSSAFQSRLVGNSLYNASMPLVVAYGSVVTLKNSRTGGAYLHSHLHLYPEGVGGARQQQITTYSHKDDNNRWIVKRYDRDPIPATQFSATAPTKHPIELVQNGDLIRLEHMTTRRNLHSHRELAPVTRKHFQVTGYGENGTGDANDVWRIEWPSDNAPAAAAATTGASDAQQPQHDPLRTVTTRFRLIHYLSNCALHSHNKQLPKWGYEQLEVTCVPIAGGTGGTGGSSGSIGGSYKQGTLWNVEDNLFPPLPNVSITLIAPSFWSRFTESHAVMFQGNAGLKPKEGEVTSRPWQWPLALKGQYFSGGDYKIYLLGNPPLWWTYTALVAAYVPIQLVLAIRLRRCGPLAASAAADGLSVPSAEKKIAQRVTWSCLWLFAGWAVHYWPFYFMGRVLYYHHYFPSAIYAAMLSAVLLDAAIRAARHAVLQLGSDRSAAILAASMTHTLFGSIAGLVLYSFWLFAPLATGFSGGGGGGDSAAVGSESNQMASLKWLKSWEF